MFYFVIGILTTAIASLDIIIGIRLKNETIINDLFEVNPILICAGVIKLGFVLIALILNLIKQLHIATSNKDQVKTKIYYHNIIVLFSNIFLFFIISWNIFCMSIFSIVVSGKYSNAHYTLIIYSLISAMASFVEIGLFIC
jgi:hypothetical protein